MGTEKARPSPFDGVLAQELGRPPVRFSRHAQERLQTSGVAFGTNEMQRLGQAVDVAASKGARQSLVLLDGTALIVSVKNRTVVTAVSGERMHDNVFTNIDSAVIPATRRVRNEDSAGLDLHEGAPRPLTD
jgi:flagellar operon protein